MERKIDFNFTGHTGMFSVRPLECPCKRQVCAIGMMRFDKTWLIFDKAGDKYQVCPMFVSLGPDVLRKGTNDKFPVVIECAEEKINA